MKNLLVLLLISTFSLAANAEIYRSQDKDGRVIYTDQPGDDQQALELPKSNTIPAVSIPEKPAVSDAETAAPFSYSWIKITSPEDDSGMEHGPGDFTVTFSSKPKLQKDHQIRLLMDGKAIKSTHDNSIQVSNANRGSHVLQAQIIDQNGVVMKQSGTVTVHVFRPSILSPGR